MRSSFPRVLRGRGAPLLAVFLLSSALGAPPEAPPPDPAARPAPPLADADTLLDAGLDALYDLDYDEARRLFGLLADRSPDDPLGVYALTTTHWWELTNDYDEKDDTVEKRFLADAERTVRVAQRRIEVGDPRGEARLCLGGALGLISRWEAIQGRWLRAYRHGKQAFNAQKEATEVNPELYDAYLGVGIFHYYAATLPKVVKFLAHLVFGGDKAQGLREIRLAMEKGRFSRTAARLFLVGIYLNTEKEPDTALALVREGRARYPRSPFFHFLEVLALERARDWEAMRREARLFIERVQRGDPFYRAKYLHRGHLALANSLLGEGRAREALPIYDRVLAAPPYDDRWISLAYLYRGKAHDLLGERDLARADYGAVLKRRDVWGLHDQADDLLDTPYRGLTPP